MLIPLLCCYDEPWMNSHVRLQRCFPTRKVGLLIIMLISLDKNPLNNCHRGQQFIKKKSQLNLNKTRREWVDREVCNKKFPPLSLLGGWLVKQFCIIRLCLDDPVQKSLAPLHLLSVEVWDFSIRDSIFFTDSQTSPSLLSSISPCIKPLCSDEA